MTWYDPEKTLIADTECYPNLWCIGFRRVSDGKTLVLEHSRRQQLDRRRLFAILAQNMIVGYNWQGYDCWMCAKATEEAVTNDDLKRLNDQIIGGNLKYWEVQDVTGVVVPRRWKFIDLMGPKPTPFGGLKTFAGRLHTPKMQDLPFEPDAILTDEQWQEVKNYLGNDLAVTHSLFQALIEPLNLRINLGTEYGMDFTSKSDSQVGEAIVKKRVEQETGEKVQKVPTPAGTSFRYKVPPYMRFDTPELQAILDRLRETDFVVQANGKVELPPFLDGREVTIGETTYAMGIGGLHSTESQRSVHSDDSQLLVDCDVTGYYPNIIINSGLYPKSLGPQFLPEYTKIRDERSKAKRRMQEIDRDIAALEAQLAELEEA